MPGLENSSVSLGDLPCPDCGYLRGGLDRSSRCTECGADGFSGSLVLSGMGDVPTGPGWWRSLRNLGIILAVSLGLVVLGAVALRLGLPELLMPMIIVPGGLVLLALLWFALSTARRLIRTAAARDDESEQGSIWEVSADGVQIRSRLTRPRFIARSDVISVTTVEAANESRMIVLLTIVGRDPPVRSFRLHEQMSRTKTGEPLNHTVAIALSASMKDCRAAAAELRRLLGKGSPSATT